MNVSIHANPDDASAAAADRLADLLLDPATRNIMVAAGNTPIELYRRIADRKLRLAHLNVFVLDEYVGVPANEPRSCAGLLRRSVAEAWGIPRNQFHTLDPDEARALESVLAHERRIEESGGLDAIILGLGQNGHLGFNEPGSEELSGARVVGLEPISVEANRTWFGGDFAPDRGVTVGLRTILAARHVLLLAYGPAKADAVRAALELARSPTCPASFLQGHPDVQVFLDPLAAAGLGPTARSHR